MQTATPILIQGTPENIGLTLGELAQEAMHEWIVRTDEWACLMEWYGTSTITRLIDTVQKAFPTCCDELYGISTGLGMEFEKVFIWNCRAELLGVSSLRSSTLAWNRLGSRSVFHRLSGIGGNEGAVRLATIHPDGMPGFATVYAPGELPGNTIAATTSGMVHAVNRLDLPCALDGVPTGFINRAVLGTQSLLEAIELVMEWNDFGAAHHTLGSAHEFVMVSIESERGQRSIVPVASKYAHTNHAIHDIMKSATHMRNVDSEARLEEMRRLLEEIPPHPDEMCIDQTLTPTTQCQGPPELAASGDVEKTTDSVVTLVTTSETDIRFSVRSTQESTWLTHSFPLNR
ncbi:C45 family autoproteolytic acyltransferase/hydolase [Noviherbaspirillum saxi]|uniref:Peptidase C45 hydrolase domain-containing protein n=1 Tax=Noviherbaspirillum saxi TaxID=2320863 RepID=A0A3A3FH14_9BURK|nr:C45 family peptidase [Noviherbaspirillum saxi]RJF92696.1 hypothetical protein D3871_29395 [Noviherbaspirillum saxi]